MLNRAPFRTAGQLRQEKFNLKHLFDLGHSVGWNGGNDRNDVAKVEYLLGRAGDLNLAKTEGLTGYYGARLEQAVKSYQKRHNLKVDGHLNPEGPTINSLRMQMAAKEDDPADEKKPKTKALPLIQEKSGEPGDIYMNTEALAPGTKDKNDFSDVDRLFPRKYWGM